jgi:hypothetical protein
MNDSSELERRYRRLLALYPKAVRGEREDEMLSVLMAGAARGQRQPRLPEAGDLLTGALRMRARQATPPGDWERRHARVMLPVRVAIGLWLAFLTTVLYGFGRGGWWGALLVPAAVLHFSIAYRLRRVPRR